MQNDPDLIQTPSQPAEQAQPPSYLQTAQQEIYSHPLTNAVYTAGTGASGGKISVYLATFFTLLNTLFLGIGALYSTNIVGDGLASDGSSYFVVAAMVLIAGSLGLTSAVIAIHLSKALNMFREALVNRILLIAIVVLAVIVLTGPVITRITS